MARTFTIYLSNEVSELIEQRRNNEKDFNLSALIAAYIHKDLAKTADNIEKINLLIEQKKAQQNLLQTEIDTLIVQVKDIMATDEQYRKELKEEEEYQKQKMDIQNFLKQMTQEETEEYKQGIEAGKWKGYVDYAKFKLNGGSFKNY